MRGSAYRNASPTSPSALRSLPFVTPPPAAHATVAARHGLAGDCEADEARTEASWAADSRNHGYRGGAVPCTRGVVRGTWEWCRVDRFHLNDPHPCHDCLGCPTHT